MAGNKSMNWLGWATWFREHGAPTAAEADRMAREVCGMPLVSSWCALRLCGGDCHEEGCECECHEVPEGIVPAGDVELTPEELADIRERWQAAEAERARVNWRLLWPWGAS